MRAPGATWAVVLMLGCGACTGAAPKSASPPTSPSAPEGPPAKQSSTPPPSEAPSETQPVPAPPAEAPATAQPVEREVKYVVTGGKLEIRVDGVRFRPTAKAIRVAGGWGVRLTVEGEAEDDKLHSLLSPKNGALAFGGKAQRKGEAESISDKRDGEEEVIIAPGTPLKLVREWPGKGGTKPLLKGDKLELHVGLWGLGPDAESRRPLNRLLILTMSAMGGEPRPMIAPPQ